MPPPSSQAARPIRVSFVAMLLWLLAGAGGNHNTTTRWRNIFHMSKAARATRETVRRTRDARCTRMPSSRSGRARVGEIKSTDVACGPRRVEWFLRYRDELSASLTRSSKDRRGSDRSSGSQTTADD